MSRFSFAHGEPIATHPGAGIRRAFAEAWGTRGFGRATHPKILVALTETQPWLPWLAQASELLDVSQLARVQRHRNLPDRQTLTLAYALHRLMLGAVLGQDPLDVPLRRDERGRPWLEGDIAATSLSHADGAIAMAVATSGPVGIDIEPTVRAEVMPEIAARVCHPGEGRDLARLPERERALAQLALWVRKEAVLKAAGVGLAVEMELFPAPDGGTVQLPGHSEAIGVRMLEAGRRWRVAIAGAIDAEVESGWTGPGCIPRYYRLSIDPRRDTPCNSQRARRAG